MSSSSCFGATGLPLVMSLPPYWQTNDDQGHLDNFQSITTHPDSQSLSFEELRIYDYANRRSGVVARPTALDCMVPTKGLVPVFITAGMFQGSSRRTPANRAIAYGASTIIFRVGGDAPTDFVIHEGLAVLRSPFVRSSLKGEWKEAQDRIIPLPDDTPEVFSLYQQWIYSGNIYSNHADDEAKQVKEYEVLVKAYIMGEKLMDSIFKDTIISCIIERMHATLTFDHRLSELVYDNTPSGSPLRRLWRDVYAWLGRPSWLDESLIGGAVHPDLTAELSSLCLGFAFGQRPASTPFARNSCPYHEHAAGFCEVGRQSFFS